MPRGITNLSSGVFAYCSSLNGIVLPSGLISIGSGAFSSCTNLGPTITIPKGVSGIGVGAFSTGPKLTGIFFAGDAPNVDTNAFQFGPSATVYYLPGMANWGAIFGGRPALLWNPSARTSDANFGVKANRFGFDVAGTTNIPLVIEASTSLAAPIWVPLQSCTLTNGLFYFVDAAWTNYPSRNYRFRSP